MHIRYTGAAGGKWVVPLDYGIKSEYPNEPQTKKVWLFNITGDPNEKVDLSGQYPEIVEMLIDKLKSYYKNLIFPNYPSQVRKSDPEQHGGLWKAWT